MWETERSDRDLRLRKTRVLVPVPHLLDSSCSEVPIGTRSAQPTRNPSEVASFVSLDLKTGIEHTLGRGEERGDDELFPKKE